MSTPAADRIAAAWDRLDRAAASSRLTPILDRFAAEPDRLARLTVEAAGLTLDLAKQSWSLDGLDAVLELVRASGVEAARDGLFGGAIVNRSEGRAVLHSALRAPDGSDLHADGVPVSAEVEAGRHRMRALADGVRDGTIRGATGNAFKAILHIGIGGSDLGPRLVWEALKPLDPSIDLRFVANVDGAEIVQALTGLDPETTLVIAVSKTFTTLETLANAEAARDWLRAGLGEDGARLHFAAVSAAPERAVTALADIADAAPTGDLTPYSIGTSIARHMPEHSVISDDAVTSGLPVYLQTRTARPHDWLSLTGGAIGQGIPVAVGAAIASPGRKVLSLNGDGAAAYTVQGLWTMVRENLDVVTVIFANHAYRILNIELARTKSGNAGPQARRLLDLGDPRMDWVAMAQGFGMPATRCDTAEAFDAALARALAGQGPHLIEAVLG